MRILLIDDHDLFREGLKYLLPVLDDKVQYLEAGSLAEALEVAVPPDGSAPAIDLVLLDFHMPGIDGMEALQRCRDSFESATLVIVSGEEDPRIIHHAVESGAAGFIPKSSSREELVSALKLVLAGGTYLPPNALRPSAGLPGPAGATDGATDGAAGLAGRLSQRQFEVLMKAVQGKSNKVIARELDISDHTVKAHLSVAFRQLGVQNRTEAVYIAAKLGFQPGHYHEAHV